MRSLLRYDEPSTIDVLRREMDHLFDDLVPLSWRRTNGERAELAQWAPLTDLIETDDAYQVRADLPGMTKKDVKVNFQDGRLIISGEREKEEKEESKEFIRRERTYGSFFKSLTLPSDVKESNIKASFKDGVLNITLPKTEPKKAKTVAIE